MTRRRGLLWTGAAIAVAAASWWWVERSRSLTNMGEFVPPNEDYYIAQLVSSSVESINTSKNTRPPYRRDVHAKTHGCLQAEVKVLPGIALELRQGVFETPNRSYKGWIRYSSGNTNVQHDAEKDARGMALKLTGVEGADLLGLPEDAGSQDFIMINSPVFFIRNVEEYAKFARLLADGVLYGYFLGGKPTATPSMFSSFSLNPFTWHLRDMMLALGTLKKAPQSLLHEQYYSLTAYTLGPSLNVKVSAKACTAQPVAAVDRKNANFLREEMKGELSRDAACFDLMVQKQIEGRNMPIEDPTVEWKESQSRFVPVARVTIPKQNFDTPEQNTFCENLSFSPWHARPEHRPLGGLNRVRRAVYLEDSRYRRAMNGAVNKDNEYAPLREPRGWCLDLSGAGCPADPGAGAPR